MARLKEKTNGDYLMAASRKEKSRRDFLSEVVLRPAKYPEEEELKSTPSSERTLLIHLPLFYRPYRPEHDEQNPPYEQSSKSPHDLKHVKQPSHWHDGSE